MELLKKLDLERLKNYPYTLDILLGLILNDIGTEDFFIKIEKNEIFAITNHKSFLLPPFFTIEAILNNLNYSNINKTTCYNVKEDTVLNINLTYRVAIHQITEDEYTISFRYINLDSSLNNLKNIVRFSDKFLDQYHNLKNKLENNLVNKPTVKNKNNKM